MCVKSCKFSPVFTYLDPGDAPVLGANQSEDKGTHVAVTLSRSDRLEGYGG